MMRRTGLITVALLVMTFAWSTITCALTLNYASVSGATITFNGTDRTFAFPHTGAYDFVIGAPGSGSLYGNIGGTFTIGEITTSTFLGVTYETADVSGTGTFSIYDGNSKTLTAALTWPAMDALKYNQYISSGFLNTAGTANISNILYGGSNADLLFLFNNQPAISIVSFQFIFPGQTLTQLATGGVEKSTTISGSLSAIPIPASVLLLGTGLLGLVGLGWKRRKTS